MQISSQSAAATKNLPNTKVEHLWDSSLSWKLFLAPFVKHHKMSWLKQLRGFILASFLGSPECEMYMRGEPGIFSHVIMT